MGVGVMATLHWPAARGSTGLRRGCRMLMLNWPSWEERRKGGEGRIEDGRPSQAKNAIAPVVGAGRPLCLDRTGSGDTQDEPRDHWHLLADRLVARARREVLGPTGRRLPIPCPGFGCLGAFSGCQPLLLPPSPLYPSYRTPHTPIPGPCESLPRLDPWPFLFLRAPAGPSLPRARRNSMSNFHSYRPPPQFPALVVDLSPSLQQGLGVVAHFSGVVTTGMGRCGPETSHWKWVSGGVPFHINTAFLSFP